MSPMKPSLLLLPLLCACSDYEFVGGDGNSGGEDGEACTVDVPPAASVDQDDSCAFETEPGRFDPVVEWQWDTNVGSPGYDQVMMQPVVGDVDVDGVPEVVFTAYTNPNYGSAGALVIVSGDGAGEERSWTNIDGYAPYASSGVALGDIDADGTPEIIVISTTLQVLALHADGTLLWASDARSSDFGPYSTPAIADMDGDGLAEVVVGRAIFDHLGRLTGAGTYGDGGDYGISAVVDLDLDGQQEVVVGNAAYRRDGSAIWANGMDDGWTAVGDFDGDGLGEVVSVGNGYTWLLDTDGTVLWGPNAVPGGGGGPPTVADFDGDGQPEVGVAGYSGYVVYDTDGSELWLAATTDQSSARTGSSVFDFEGDGSWEVVYADELVLWVFDGATGAPLLIEDGHASWTLFEYPVIADADGDGDAEIVLASNNSTSDGWQGITAIGDATGTWAPTTRTWNQHAYHITNVEDDLSIPTQPMMNWEVGINSFRAGGLRDAPGFPLANLRAVIVDACWTCDDGSGGSAVQLAVQVENHGLADVDGVVSVSAYVKKANGDTALLGSFEVPAPAAGEAPEGVVVDLVLPEIEQVANVWVRVDDPGVVFGGDTEGDAAECDEDDNSATVVPEGC
jgi:FG-GAP-like repeat